MLNKTILTLIQILEQWSSRTVYLRCENLNHNLCEIKVSTLNKMININQFILRCMCNALYVWCIPILPRLTPWHYNGLTHYLYTEAAIKRCAINTGFIYLSKTRKPWWTKLLTCIRLKQFVYNVEAYQVGTLDPCP